MRRLALLCLVLVGCGEGYEPGDIPAADTNSVGLAVTTAAPIRRFWAPGTALSKAAATSASSGGTNGIGYHGGPLMLGTTNVYFIWYGNWPSSTTKTIVHDLVNGLSGSAYFDINTTYYDSSDRHVSNSLRYAGETTDYSRGNALLDSDIQAIVSSALTSGRLRTDPNGIYLVMTAADVTESATLGSFCGGSSGYCGWHADAMGNNVHVKYGFIGNPMSQCPATCGKNSNGPNGDPAADAMATSIAHEIEESVTDPEGSAWYDVLSTGGLSENADKCAWRFGTTYTAANGTQANMRLGSRDFLIQQNWVNADGGSCALSFNNTDVGVIAAGTTCPTGELVTLHTDDEDTGNSNTRSGWIGAIQSGQDTTMTFCKVPGAPFTPLAPASGGISRPYSVLKLGRVCPAGSVEFTRTMDNEDTGNTNSFTGDISPNVAKPDAQLHFCLFPGSPSGASDYPEIGLGSYGVFGPSISAFGRSSGSFRTDDEDTGNADSMSCGSFCTDAQRTVSAGSDTTFYVAQAKACEGASNGFVGCRGSGCYVCSELVQNYPKYFANHPNCVSNGTCGGQYYACNVNCPAPSWDDR